MTGTLRNIAMFSRSGPAACLTLLLALLLSGPAAAASDTTADKPPRWSIEAKGGNFYPAADNWSDFYGSNRMWEITGSLAYKVIRQVEFGVEAGVGQDHGTGYAPASGIATGRVDYDVFPLNLFVLYRAVFKEEQWLVPYAGGGYTRLFYQQKIEGQEKVRGAANGYHGKAGLQLLLDGIDLRAANNMYLDYGIRHTYLVFEAQYISAKTDTNSGSSVDLGGISYLGGFLFEF